MLGVGGRAEGYDTARNNELHHAYLDVADFGSGKPKTSAGTDSFCMVVGPWRLLDGGWSMSESSLQDTGNYTIATTASPSVPNHSLISGSRLLSLNSKISFLAVFRLDLPK